MNELHLHSLGIGIGQTFLGGKFGKSGDDKPYPYTISGQYAISQSQWTSFKRQMFRYYWNQFQDSNPRINVFFNINDQSTINWAINQFPGFWPTGSVLEL